MIALLLAAGQGKRLLPYTKEIPKALLTIDEKERISIIEHQVYVLKRVGITEIYTVIGYKGEKIQKTLKDSVKYIENPDFDTTNSIYSVYLSLHVLKNEAFILNADVLFPEKVLTLLLNSQKEALISVDSQAQLDEETMKVAVNGERVVKISKKLPPEEAFGENLGVVKFSGESLQVLKKCVKKLVERGLTHQWFPASFAEFMKEKPLYYVDVKGIPWIEIDFPEDLFKARREIFPKIK